MAHDESLRGVYRFIYEYQDISEDESILEVSLQLPQALIDWLLDTNERGKLINELIEDVIIQTYGAQLEEMSAAFFSSYRITHRHVGQEAMRMRDQKLRELPPE